MFVDLGNMRLFQFNKTNTYHAKRPFLIRIYIFLTLILLKLGSLNYYTSLMIWMLHCGWTNMFFNEIRIEK